MIEYLQNILITQFEAALAMTKQRIEVCPQEHFEGMIGNYPFRQMAYHTLFWLDHYLTHHEDNFVMSEFNLRGGDERKPGLCEALTKEDTLAYVEYCRKKITMSIRAETETSLQGGSGFPSIFVKTKLTRGELYLYNLRHLQHHSAQLSTYLRNISIQYKLSLDLPWIGSGWK
jgi:hypothetical protein